MQYFKKNINLFIVIVLFIVLCVSYILIIPVFEAPDENWHFMYAFYISKYNRISSVYNESIAYEQYIKERMNEGEDPMFFMDEKYMLYKLVSGEYTQLYSSHHPPLYYLIASQIIKPLGVDNIDAEYNYENLNKPNIYINNKILKDSSTTNSLVLILRLFQIVYGVLVIIFIYKIIKLLSNDKFENKLIILLSGIAFLPQFIFLCSYINNDLLSALFGLISVYFIVLLFKRNRAYLGLVSILFAIIGGFTKYTVLIMVPVTIIAFLIWLIIKKKIWAILTFLLVIFLTISAFYYILNFQRLTYGRSGIEAAWNEGYKYENIEDARDMLVSEKNYALSFDGIDDKISVSSIPYMTITELTLESRVFIRSFNKGDRWKATPIVSNWNSLANGEQTGYLLCVVYNPGNDMLEWNLTICDDINKKGVSFDQLPYDDFVTKYANKWLNISAVFKSEEYLKLLIGGEVVATNDIDIPEKIELNENIPTYFGYSSGYIGINEVYTDGLIDEIRIWNLERTQEQIRDDINLELTGNEEGLVGYWKFNEGKGSVVYDSTANKNHGKIEVTVEESRPLFNRISTIINKLIADFKDNFFSKNADIKEVKGSSFINTSALTGTFKSTVAFFGWMNIAADNFIYYFFLAYVISGILVFFANIRDYRKSKKLIIFIILSIITIFTYFLLYATYGDRGQTQGRGILLAVFLTYILAILGFKSIKESYRNVLYYGLFASSLLISVFCLYNYIYLKYY